MAHEERHLAAACGLYCGACGAFIATQESPERLSRIAAMLGLPEDEVRCDGCRTERKFGPCRDCRIMACTKEKGVEFCSQCDEYPCEQLRGFQGAMPHRADLWDDLQRLRDAGAEEWLAEVRRHFACADCGTINSAYDVKCRRCGHEPGNDFVARHRDRIDTHLAAGRKPSLPPRE